MDVEPDSSSVAVGHAGFNYLNIMWDIISIPCCSLTLGFIKKKQKRFRKD